jgi:DNA-binding SARP family transcriptional activator/TolB-like protein/tetratricopeptide (TPR) repeat protein
MLEGETGPVRGRATHRRRIALLAILSMARGRPVARERLIGLLWPENPSDGARHLLSESLYVLRKALGEKAIVAVGDEVALTAAEVGCDAAAFLEAVESGDPGGAVSLYRGPFMDGFYLSQADEFERWVEVERDRLARALAQALERLAEEEELGGDFLAAAGWWHRLVTHDPYSSRVVLRLMRSLETAGEHAAALRAAAEHTVFLRDDLGAHPDPAVPIYAERLRTAPTHGTIPPLPEPPPKPAAPEESRAAAAPLPAPEVWAADRTPAAAPVRRRRAWLAPAALLTALATAVTVGLAAVRGGGAAHSTAIAGEADPRHVAVLYFEDHSRGDTLRHIANDLTGRLIDELAHVPSLRVVSANGVRPFRDGNTPLDSVARALGVGTVVAGSVQGAGDRLHVVVRLLDPMSGRQLASRTVERRLGDLLALEAEVVRQAAEFLRPRMGREIRLRETSSGTRDAAARELFLRGRQRWEDATELSAGPNPLHADAVLRMLNDADSLLVSAAARDPRWADPHVVRGWVALAEYAHTPAREHASLFGKATASAERALALQPGDAGALELRGTARWRMVQLDAVPAGGDTNLLTRSAEGDLNAALSRDLSRAGAWATLSQLLRVQEGRLAEADVAAKRALAADEFLEDAPLIIERLYRSSVQLARFDVAGEWCSLGARRYPGDWRFLECQLTLLGYDGARPDMVLAWRLARQLDQLDPPETAVRAGRGYSPVFRRMLVARVAARAGLADSARAVSMRARAEVRGDPAQEGSQAADEAYVRLLLGERDSAIALLARHLRAQPRLRAQVASNVKFRALHTDPRFRRVVAGDAPARGGGSGDREERRRRPR